MHDLYQALNTLKTPKITQNPHDHHETLFDSCMFRLGKKRRWHACWILPSIHEINSSKELNLPLEAWLKQKLKKNGGEEWWWWRPRLEEERRELFSSSSSSSNVQKSELPSIYRGANLLFAKRPLTNSKMFKNVPPAQLVNLKLLD